MTKNTLDKFNLKSKIQKRHIIYASIMSGLLLISCISLLSLSQYKANYHAPLLVNLNTELITEEVLRTSVACIGMLLAMPLTTYIAAYILPRWKSSTNDKTIS